MNEPTTIAQPTDPHNNPDLNIETFRLVGDGTAYDGHDTGEYAACPPPARNLGNISGTVRVFGDPPTASSR